ncbi:MAG: hypothetical protein M1818_000707 [Claussenomyces sp. TS43310]|nr:MAG: hypothetical protein M1818_000707 [Claussenomyces sp. TS43310]
MKIVEVQSATLTNYEVYTHLTEQRARHELRGKKRRGPGNFETVVKEVGTCDSDGGQKDCAYSKKLLDYLRKAPSPLGERPVPYNSNTIRTLLSRLRIYDLTKAEVLMILNHRPTKVAALNTIVEELEQRFPQHSDQIDIVQIIVEVLGSPDQEAELQAMTDAAKDARQAEAMDVSREELDADGSR